MFFLKVDESFVLLVICLQLKAVVCLNRNVVLLNRISSTLNSSINPCEDFYSYACGGYAEQHPSPSYQEITGYMDQQYNIIILNLMEAVYQHDHQVYDHCQSFVEKARVYLEACRTERYRNLSRYFEEITPAEHLNWPIFEEQFSSWPYNIHFDILSLLGRLQSYGMNNVFIYQEVSVDAEGVLSLTIEPAFSENNKTLPDTNILLGLLRALGSKNPVKLINILQQIDRLLLKILENHAEEEVEVQEIYYADLGSLYPNLNLTAYLQELLSHQLRPNTIILLHSPAYFRYLNENIWLLFKKPQLCSYLMMQFIVFLAEDSTEEFTSMACVKDLRNKFDLAVNYLFYYHIYSHQARYINGDIEQILTNIINMLQQQFCSNNLHLQNSQILLLMEKLAGVRLNIGNLPENVTIEKIEQFYNSVRPMDNNNYYKNHLSMLKHRFQKSLHHSCHQTHFIVPDNRLGSSSGAFYVAKQNMIILPFGSLMQPMYDLHYHDLFKYSLLGFILAHELTHAFDTYGLNFNTEGENSIHLAAILNENSFPKSLECLQSQLPTDSIDERIADIVASQLVNKIFTSNLNSQQLICFNDQWNKYFYLNLAQFFCGKVNIKFIDHDSDAERLNQIVSNSAGFARAFKCPQNSQMNPKEKCRLY